MNALEKAYAMTDEVIVTNTADASQNSIATTDYTFGFFSALSPDYSDNNNFSPIMNLSYAGRNIIMTGDAEKENEKEFVEKMKEIRAKNSNSLTADEKRYNDTFTSTFNADIIKFGHHGSRTSSSEDLLNIVSTSKENRTNTYSIISAGEGNSYKHPHPETLTRIKDMGFSSERTLRTDLHKNIMFEITSNGNIKCYTDQKATIGAVFTSGDGTVILEGDKETGGEISGSITVEKVDNNLFVTLVNMIADLFKIDYSLAQTILIIIIVVIAVIVVTVAVIVIVKGVKKNHQN